MPHDDLAWADLSSADDPVLVAWLAGASCDPHVKALVVAAVHACDRGVSAAQWRHGLLARHPDAAALVAEAEECMRSAGLWPWHDRVPGADEADG
jgi:hypothetical protein